MRENENKQKKRVTYTRTRRGDRGAWKGERIKPMHAHATKRAHAREHSSKRRANAKRQRKRTGRSARTHRTRTHRTRTHSARRPSAHQMRTQARSMYTRVGSSSSRPLACACTMSCITDKASTPNLTVPGWEGRAGVKFWGSKTCVQAAAADGSRDGALAPGGNTSSMGTGVASGTV